MERDCDEVGWHWIWSGWQLIDVMGYGVEAVETEEMSSFI